jgi:prepilin-type N-terminal cleavage/methylation domain-containing protein
MRRNSGFTLIELMVVLVIAGLLLGGVYTMLIRQQQSYQTQNQVVEVQQNLRSTFILLRYDLRMIGHGLTEGTAPISAHLNNQAGVLGSDAITFVSNVGPASVTIPDGAVSSYPLVTGSAVSVPVASVEGFPTATPYTIDLLDFSTGTLIANAEVTGVTEGSPSTLTLMPCPVVSCPASMNLSLVAGSYIGLTPQTISYLVDLNTTADCQNPPCLERTVGGVASVLAEGVEDFQVAYGFDGINGMPVDGNISETGNSGNDDEWVYNTSGDTWPTDISGLRAIRIALLLRTTNRDPGYQGAMTGVLEDHTWTSALDGYRRRVVQFVENVRNLSL